MNTESLVKKIIRSVSRSYADPGGSKYPVICLQDVLSVSRQFNTSSLSIEITSLEQGIVPMRYLRNLGTIGIKGQLKLLKSCVAIAGAGGLGGIIIELLARIGTGRLIIIDNGRFTENNLNRQLLATEKLMGKSKSKAAADRVRQVNSSVAITAVSRKIDDGNCQKLIQDANVVVDALDNLPSRYILAEACQKLGIPLVHGAIAGFSGQAITVLPGDKGLVDLYGPLNRRHARGIEAVTGSPPTTATVIGALEVQETVKLITGTGKNIHGHLLMLDIAENSSDEVSF